MKIHTYKTQKTKSTSDVASQKEGNGKLGFQFIDSRPEAFQMEKLEELSNSSLRRNHIQFEDNRPESDLQRRRGKMSNNNPRVSHLWPHNGMAINYHAPQQQSVQKKKDITGLPDNLKLGIESLSGLSLNDVKVHRNSDKPARFRAHAYAHGTDIHLGPGQEKHLPHEAWHVVQQKQGRVKPTMQMRGNVLVNDDVRLEKEADVMGQRASMRKSPSAKDLGYQNKQGNFLKDYRNLTQKVTLRTAVMQRYHPNDDEVGSRFQVESATGWTVGTLDNIHEDDYVFTTREGQKLVISNVQHERIRPTTGAIRPSGIDIPSSGRSIDPNKMFASRIVNDREAVDEMVISGHGRFNENLLDSKAESKRQKSATFIVPDGVQIILYAPSGAAMDQSIGHRIEQGNPPGSEEVILRQNDGSSTQKLPGEYPYRFTSGSEVINYTVTPPNGLSVLGKAITVDKPTSLREIVVSLKGKGGTIHYACCSAGYSDKKEFRNLFPFKGWYVDLKR
jgi:hypothetical protein